MSIVTLKLVTFALLHFGITLGAVATLHRPPRFRRAQVQVEEEEEACAGDSGGAPPGSAST